VDTNNVYVLKQRPIEVLATLNGNASRIFFAALRRQGCPAHGAVPRWTDWANPLG
jgi:hypothetical protein